MNTTHGLSHTQEFLIWSSIKTRCFNEKSKMFASYGAKGITMAPRWRDSFEAFLGDVGPRPSPLHSIDRYPNREGNYEVGNVRWATPVQQANNRSSSVVLRWRGEEKTMAEWARIVGMNQSTIGMRLRRGWSVDDALEKPLGHRPSRPGVSEVQ
jgi:hypothetical protein